MNMHVNSHLACQQRSNLTHELSGAQPEQSNLAVGHVGCSLCFHGASRTRYIKRCTPQPLPLPAHTLTDRISGPSGGSTSLPAPGATGTTAAPGRLRIPAPAAAPSAAAAASVTFMPATLRTCAYGRAAGVSNHQPPTEQPNNKGKPCTAMGLDVCHIADLHVGV